MQIKPLISCLMIGAVIGSSSVFADSVPVIEVQPVDGNSAGGSYMASPGSVGSSSNGQYEQVQALQREVQSLRGLIEQLSYKVQQLQDDQRDRYSDLDRRLSELSSSSQSSSETADAGAGQAASSASTASAASAAAEAPAASGSEQDDYRAAFELVRARSFDQAAVAYQKFVTKYPSSSLAGNSYYWLGEIYLVKSPPDVAKSMAAFKTVVDKYSDNRKVPDALYKLGMLSDKQGDKASAKKYLQQVISGYADSSAAKLAGDYLKGIK
ncbi:hypothetical protein WH50_03855 [Pokkaliibacter plantistimulans]|uniref:Cell division coordinator CpoB n=1 Tax=Pokkaliibacter plantistimulans TaxID=1635171 RepID=A0ABX5M499_9GAMM|nr:tol-pal system protein YbgF [Pokkaliibacter plantistimulans]PXF32543.1 hypothetical protein WH50_03855 [Pokkaliibacter plantistimulans]